MTQIVLFKKLRDVEKIGILGRQLGERSTLLKVYKRVTQEAFAHFLIDLDVRSSRTSDTAHIALATNHPIFIAPGKLFTSINDEFTK